ACAWASPEGIFKVATSVSQHPFVLLLLRQRASSDFLSTGISPLRQSALTPIRLISKWLSGETPKRPVPSAFAYLQRLHLVYENVRYPTEGVRKVPQCPRP